MPTHPVFIVRAPETGDRENHLATCAKELAVVAAYFQPFDGPPAESDDETYEVHTPNRDATTRITLQDLGWTVVSETEAPGKGDALWLQLQEDEAAKRTAQAEHAARTITALNALGITVQDSDAGHLWIATSEMDRLLALLPQIDEPNAG